MTEALRLHSSEGVPSSSPAAIAAESVRVALGGTPVIHGVDCHVAAGELVALVGPNGAGKSTLLAALAGDLHTAGTVRILGEDTRALSPTTLARRRAVLLQQHTIAFPFRVEEVVAMGRAPWARNADPRADEDAVEEALALTETAQFRGRTVTSLSGGERARVMLARALAQTTPVLLFDEPTAALDPQHQAHTLDVLACRARAGTAVLVILHDLTAAAAHADRIIVLAGGRVRADGRPRAVLTPNLLSEVYRTPLDVFPHPETGVPIVVPTRPH